jgi:hypothetical protein
LLAPAHSTEKTSVVLPERAEAGDEQPAAATDTQPSKAGHGRNAAAAFNGGHKEAVRHATLMSGDRCPDCEKGKVYVQKQHRAMPVNGLLKEQD